MKLEDMKLIEKEETPYLETALENRTPPEGYLQVVPTPNQLFVDVDDPEEFARRWSEIGPSVGMKFGLVDIRTTPSRTPGHCHTVIVLKQHVSDLERIALQAILGGDPKREFLSLLRVREGIANPTLFFEKEQ